LIDDDKLVDGLLTDYRKASLTSADRAMLDYSAKLTLTPWEMEESDVEVLRKEGFNDTAILDINQVTSYYAFVNRLADGLGVELEGSWREDPVG